MKKILFFLLLIFILPIIYAVEVDEPFSFYPMDDLYVSGTTIHDIMSFSNATASGINTSMSGYDAEGVLFEMNNDKIDLNLKSHISGRNTFTFGVWLKRVGDCSGGCAVIGNRDNFRDFIVYDYSNPITRVQFDTDGTDRNCDNPQRLLKQNEWSHLVIVKNTTGIFMYLNGLYNYSCTGTGTTGTIDNDGGNFILGLDGPNNAYDFDGYMDEAIFFNYSLSPEQIYEVYENGYPKTGSVVDDNYPGYLYYENNASNSAIYSTVSYTVNLTDDVNLTGYIISSNITGIWQNESVQKLNIANHSFSYNINITYNKDTYICNVVYFNDSFNQWNKTNESCFTVFNSDSYFNQLEINNSAPIIFNQDLNMKFNVNDYDNESLNVSINWYSSLNNLSWQLEEGRTINVTILNVSDYYNVDYSYFMGSYYINYSEYWKLVGMVTDGYNIYYKNSSSVYVDYYGAPDIGGLGLDGINESYNEQSVVDKFFLNLGLYSIEHKYQVVIVIILSFLIINYITTLNKQLRRVKKIK